MSPKNFTVYADGAYSPINPYVGVGVVVIDNETSFVKKDSFTPGEGTNQAAEILAAVAGLRLVPTGSEVTLYSDSQYVIGTMTSGWARRANQAHWALLDAEVQLMASVKFVHVKGHNGDKYNEICDVLAQSARTSPNLRPLPQRAPLVVPAGPAAAPIPTPVAAATPSDPTSLALSALAANAGLAILKTALDRIANIRPERGADANLRLAVEIALTAKTQFEFFLAHPATPAR